MFDFSMAILNRDEFICQYTFLIITRIINTITDHPVIKEQTRALVQLVKQRQIEPLYPVAWMAVSEHRNSNWRLRVARGLTIIRTKRYAK